MKISTTLLVLLIALQVFHTQSTYNFGWNVNKANAVLNAGDCYINPGITESGQSDVAVQYYDLPSGWRQYQDKLVVPKLLSQRGAFSFGAKAYSGKDSVN